MRCAATLGSGVRGKYFMAHEFFSALALMLVIEGIMPFLNPGRFRSGLLSAARLNDTTLRSLGLLAMLAGVVILTISR